MKLYVIGNGFDVAHGYKTDYKDFEQYMEKNHPKEKAQFENEYETELWSDFENNIVKLKFQELIGGASDEAMFGNDEELISTLPNDYTSYFAIEKYFPATAEDLKGFFEEWISSLPESKGRTKFEFEEDSIFINYNYTQTLENVYKIDNARILHPHGAVDNDGYVTKDIVVGHSEKNYTVDVNDDSPNNLCWYVEGIKERDVAKTLCDYCNSLNKNVPEHIKEIETFLEGKDVDEIRIYGHSAGTADIDYFKKLHELYPKAKWEYAVYIGEKDTVEKLDKEKERLVSAIGPIDLHVIDSSQVDYSKKVIADKVIETFERKGFDFTTKDKQTDGYRIGLARNLIKYLEQGYSLDATVSLAKAASRFIDVSNLNIKASMDLSDIENAINEEAGIFDFKKLDEEYYLVLDEETTGLGDKDEVVELAIADNWGNILYHEMYKPNCDITEEAQRITGIESKELQDKQSFGKEMEVIMEYISDVPLIIYNKAFDTRMLLQTMDIHQEEIENYEDFKEKVKEKFKSTTFCAMQSYTSYKGFHKNTKLIDALENEGIRKQQSHRAGSDCLDTILLIKKIAENLGKKKQIS